MSQVGVSIRHSNSIFNAISMNVYESLISVLEKLVGF